MSKKNINYHTYIGLCDTFRPDCGMWHMTSNLQLYSRPYRGRYYIMAKNEKKALELLRKACPFGSIQIYYQDDQWPEKVKNKYKFEPNTVRKATQFGDLEVNLETHEAIGYKELLEKQLEIQ